MGGVRRAGKERDAGITSPQMLCPGYLLESVELLQSRWIQGRHWYEGLRSGAHLLEGGAQQATGILSLSSVAGRGGCEVQSNIQPWLRTEPAWPVSQTLKAHSGCSKGVKVGLGRTRLQAVLKSMSFI